MAKAQRQCDAIQRQYQTHILELQQRNLRLRAALVIQHTAHVWNLLNTPFPRPESAPNMCTQVKPTISWNVDETPQISDKPIGSLRRKIWNLPAAAQCPVIGVCVPMARLQILLKKAGHHINALSHYQQHPIVTGKQIGRAHV